MLTPYLPYPLLSGGQIRTYNLLKNLKDKHQITLFSFIRKEEEKKHLEELEKYCYKVRVFKRRPAWAIKNIILAGFSPFPFVMISTYLSLTVRSAIARELKSDSYDLIHAEPFYMAPNIPTSDIPTLLVEQTIEYLVYKRFVDNFKNPLVKPFMYFDVLKLRLWEEHYWKNASRLVAMSRQDKKIMREAAPLQTIDIVANGVDIEFFKNTKIKRPKRPTILFVGNFKWLPNKDAAQFLTYKVWPKIKKEIKNAKLWIVGRNPTKEIVKLGSLKDVVVTKDIEDIRDAFGKATVLLAPIRNGRGTKYKVLEAMATKLPVVTTPLGIEGIDAQDGKHVLVRTGAEELAKTTVELLKNPEYEEKLSESAFKMVKENYNWELISGSLDDIYQKLGRKKL